MIKEAGHSPNEVGMIDISVKETLPETYRGMGKVRVVVYSLRADKETVDEGETNASEDDPGIIT